MNRTAAAALRREKRIEKSSRWKNKPVRAGFRPSVVPPFLITITVIYPSARARQAGAYTDPYSRIVIEENCRLLKFILLRNTRTRYTRRVRIRNMSSILDPRISRGTTSHAIRRPISRVFPRFRVIRTLIKSIGVFLVFPPFLVVTRARVILHAIKRLRLSAHTCNIYQRQLRANK